MATYEFRAADWSIERDTGAIRYIGNDHTGADPSYATVIELHRALQDFADDALASGNDELDITNTNPSARSTDNIITLINGYNIDDAAAEHLYDGSIIQNNGDDIYDGIVNFGNQDVQIQIIQNGSVVSDDYWNYQVGGTATGGNATSFTDSGASWTVNEWVGYTAINTTDGARGIITANTDTVVTVTAYADSNGAANAWATSDAYLIGQPLNQNANAGISHRFMIQTRKDGVDIDGRRLLGIARRYGNTYSEFQINGTSRGNNVLALVDTNDLNNSSTPAEAAALVITNTEGLNLIDVDNDSTDEEYYSEWDRGTESINDLYEYAKYLTRDSSGSTLYGTSGEIFRGVTHSSAYDAETGAPVYTQNDMLAYGTAIVYETEVGGPFTIGEAITDDAGAWKAQIIALDDNGATGTIIARVTFGTVSDTESFTGQESGATADVNGTPSVVSGGGLLRVLALDDDGTSGNLYYQLMNGTAPGDNALLYYVGTDPATTTDATDYYTVIGSATSRPISQPFIGASTGSALIGAYGIGVATTGLTNADLLTALDGVTYQPPNNVTNTVAGIIHGEDYVIVAPWDGSSTDTNGDPAFNKNQLQLGETLTSNFAANFDIDIQAGGDEGTPIPGDTPNAGTIRVVDDDGFERRLVYSSWTGSTFTIDFAASEAAIADVADFSVVNATLGNDMYVTYLDELASGTLVTAGSFVTGVRYVINTAGTTDFTLIGAANSSPGTIFTASGAGAGTGTANVYVTSESYTGVYSTDRDLVALVRDGGTTPIIQFIAQWSFTGSGQTLTAIRTSDA